MKKILVLIFFVSLSSSAQLQQGKIVYNYTIFWDKIYASMSFLSQAEKDRIKLTWNNEEGYTRKMNLYFSPNKSFYTYGEKNEDETYSWRDDAFFVVRDFENKKVLEYEETLGKSYIIEDDLPEYKWRVMNELKEIQGYMCMKAITFDSLRNAEISAWFCPQINVPIGPERYIGLPGAILGMEINSDFVLIEAVSITPGDFTESMVLPKKMKGKTVNSSEMNAMLEEHVANSIKAYRNPYWAMRY